MIIIIVIVLPSANIIVIVVILSICPIAEPARNCGKERSRELRVSSFYHDYLGLFSLSGSKAM